MLFDLGCGKIIINLLEGCFSFSNSRLFDAFIEEKKLSLMNLQVWRLNLSCIHLHIFQSVWNI